jgi:uncharacterized glyoxalase superfamily protein PhnB
MKLTGSVPVLACETIEPSLEFYRTALQFVIIKQRASAHGLEWVYMASGDVFLMLERVSAKPTAGGIRLYFYTDDVTRLSQYLTAKGYPVAEITTTDYGMKQFELVDPAGYRLTIGEKN